MTALVVVLSVLALAGAAVLALAWLRGADPLGTLRDALAEGAQRTGEVALEFWEWLRLGR
jgi:hypothetical protein